MQCAISDSILPSAFPACINIISMKQLNFVEKKLDGQVWCLISISEPFNYTSGRFVFNPLTAKLINLNFHLLEVVSC